MLKTIAIVIVAAVVGVLVYATTRPDNLSVQRSTRIKAPPEKIFALVNDLQQWRSWSPWEHKDPAMKRSFSGPPTGPGPAYAWEGNNDVGQGRMEIIAGTTSPTQVAMQLDFIKPFEAHNRVDFKLEPQADEMTRVTWAMSGPTPYVTKLMGIFVDMDQMIGKDFEAGLANLKAVAEK